MDEQTKYAYNSMELARVIGQPLDPKKAIPDLVQAICEVDYADPNEYVYYYDVLAETRTIYTTVASGVTQANVTPDTPAALTFVDRSSPEYWVNVTDLATSKERTLARKRKTINASLNAEEAYMIISAMSTACTGTGNIQYNTSLATTFNFNALVNMIEMVIDYADNYALVASGYVNRDIALWDWTDNKYTSLATALKELNIDIIRCNETVTRDGSATAVLANGATTAVAYLVGRSTVVGKPNLFVRKKLNDIEMIGTSILENGDKPERLIFVGNSPQTIVSGPTRFLAISLIGYENVVHAVTNPYAIAKFIRA
jgi:hypothetical protein